MVSVVGCLILGLTPAARAGSYTVAYTGDPTYSPSGGAYGKVVSAMTVAPNSQALNSAITATVTWTADPNIPNDQPPPALIVAQDSRVGWGSDNPSDSGQLSTGLSGSGITNGGNINSNRYGEETATHFAEQTQTQIIAGVKSLTLNCTPTTSVTATYEGNLTVCVDYKVTVTPVIVSISFLGTTPGNGNQNILIGQGCTSSLVCIPNVLTFSNYNWTVSGNTFQSWNGDSGTVPVGIAPGYGPANQSTAHWFWSDVAALYNVSCTATATPPAGEGSSFSVAVTQPVNLEVPAYIAHNHVGAGYIGTGPNNDFAIFAGTTVPLINQGYNAGANWNTYVPIPPDFTGTGQWQYAQIVTPGEYETPDGGTEEQSTDTGVTGLDDVFPYETLHDTGGNYITDVDSPNFPVLDTYSSVRLTDAFNTYLMFKPPLAPSAPSGNDIQWVPLAESGWTTSFGAARPSSKHWTDFPPTKTVGPVNLIYDFLRQKTHPTWFTRSVNTTVFP